MKNTIQSKIVAYLKEQNKALTLHEIVEGIKDNIVANEQKMVASKSSDVYHLAGCHVVNQIKPENRIHFSNEEEAKKSGRTRSKVKGAGSS